MLKEHDEVKKLIIVYVESQWNYLLGGRIVSRNHTLIIHVMYARCAAHVQVT